ncbi:MAG: DUF839 domain-containing protein, partial [Gammaproteobacteria bacterium]|nr:DUF839 domain-containing protein [Gammaproteobacteria bacterium]
WHAATSDNGWFASPDNGVVDPAGRLWVATDQGPAVPLSGCNDGLWALETSDELRGMGKMFYRAPSGAEVSGPCFTPDGENLFIAVQHPGDSMRPGVARVETARTRWPDFDNNTPPRPSVVVVQRKGGGKIA